MYILYPLHYLDRYVATILHKTLTEKTGKFDKLNSICQHFTQPSVVDLVIDKNFTLLHLGMVLGSDQ